MGQSVSHQEHHERTREELSRELAHRFAEKVFTPLEIYSLRDVFRQLADRQDGVRYIREDTLARFLELPDVLGASPVIFRLASYLGAFPFLRDAPTVLGLEQLVVIIVLLTRRYGDALAGGAADRTRLLFGGLAVHDRRLSEVVAAREQEDAAARKVGGGGGDTVLARGGFAVDVGADDVDDAGDDDDLVLAALEELHVDEAFRHGDAPCTTGAMVPVDNFRKLVMLLLVIAPLTPRESLARHSLRLVGDELESLRSTADSILASFVDVENAPGITWTTFKRVVPTCLPHLFDGFDALFEHFLFSKDLDFSKHKQEPRGDLKEPKASSNVPEPPPLISTGEIMDYSVLSQISFLLPGASLFGRLRPLYSGNEDGFSTGSFESKVFHWRAPTILLVRGTRISDVPDGSQEAAFASSIPMCRFPHGSRGERLTFGMYLGQPWRHTYKECLGDASTVMFQLEPVHDVFRASSSINTDYVTFTKPPSHRPYLAVGSPHVLPAQSHHHHHHRTGSLLPLGPVSLLLDGSFEFGVFNHDFDGVRGGAFASSSSRRFNFQDKFAIESLEVWGCGGDEEAKIQAERWAFEKREAEARRRINLSTGDMEADRALLEMAGLIGGNRSGGSMT